MKNTTTLRKVGFWTVLSIVIGSSIGSGIFMVPSALAKYGSLSLLGWILTGCGTMILAFAFMRLSRSLPFSGGPYVYAKHGFGDYIGFQVGWNYWIATCVSNAGLAVSFTAYAAYFFPVLETFPLYGFCCSAGIIWLLTLLNMKGIAESGVFQIITTSLKLLPIIIIIGYGALHVSVENFYPLQATSTLSSFQIIMISSTITLWAFLGFEAGTVPADDVHNPKKTIPQATFWGTLVVITIALLSNAVIMGLIPNAALQESVAPFSDAAKHLFGPMGGRIVALGAIVSILSTLNGLTIIQGQLPWAAAKDGLFPKYFNKKNHNNVPTRALIVSAIFITIMLCFKYQDNLQDQFHFLLLFSTLTTLIAYLFPILTDLKEILKTPKKNALQIFFALIGFAYIIFCMMGSGQEQIMYGSLLFFFSSIIYVCIKYKKETP